jgi:hypothetical protein
MRMDSLRLVETPNGCERHRALLGGDGCCWPGVRDTGATGDLIFANFKCLPGHNLIVCDVHEQVQILTSLSASRRD